MLLSEPPGRLPVRGSGVFIQARVCRSRPKSTGESDALAVSEALPFLEYELARQLMLKVRLVNLQRSVIFSFFEQHIGVILEPIIKPPSLSHQLKVLGRNAAFSLKSEVDVGSQLIIATATATALYCDAMPAPRHLEISRTIAVQDEEDLQLVTLQRQIETISSKNRQWLAATAQRQAAKKRRDYARKIKEAQLRKEAAKLKHKRRKEARKGKGRLTDSKPQRDSMKDSLIGACLYAKGSNAVETGSSFILVKGEKDSLISKRRIEINVEPEVAHDEEKSSSSASSSPPDSSSLSSFSSSSSSSSETESEKEAVVNEQTDLNKSISDTARNFESEVEADYDYISGDYADGSREVHNGRGIDTEGPDIEELDEIAEGVNADDFVPDIGDVVRRRRRHRLYRDDKAPFVLEIDDETDEDIMSVLLDKQLPEGEQSVSTIYLIQNPENCV